MVEWWEEYETADGKPKAAPATRSNWRRFMDSAEQFITHNSAPAWIARNIAPILDSGDPEEQKKIRAKITREERAARERFATTDPADTVGEHVVDFLGGILGSGVDPTTFIGGFGKNLGEKMVNAAGINAGIDLGMQTAEKAEGVRDAYDPVQGAINVAAPPVIMGAARGAQAAPRAVSRGIKKLMPVDGRISSGFGRRNAPTKGASTNHLAIDIAAKRGTPVQSPGLGTVSKVGRGDKVKGNWVEIDHGDGLTSRYLHLEGFNVKPGDTVNPGQLFGNVGSTGRSTGPHLHWSVFKDGKPVDPNSVDFNLSTDAPRRPAHPMSPEAIRDAVRDEEAGVLSPEAQKFIDEADDAPKTKTLNDLLEDEIDNIRTKPDNERTQEEQDFLTLDEERQLSVIRDREYEKSHQEWVDKNFDEGEVVIGYGDNFPDPKAPEVPLTVRDYDDIMANLDEAFQTGKITGDEYLRWSNEYKNRTVEPRKDNVEQFPVVPRNEAVTQKFVPYGKRDTSKVVNIREPEHTARRERMDEYEASMKSRRQDTIKDLTDLVSRARDTDFPLTAREVSLMREESGIDFSLKSAQESKLPIGQEMMDDLRDIHALFDELETTLAAVRSGEAPYRLKPELTPITGGKKEAPATTLDRIKKTLKDIMKDERGSYRDPPADDRMDPPLEDVDRRLIEDLASFKPLNNEQRRMYHAERSKRAGSLHQLQKEPGGLENYKQQLTSQKGKLPRVAFESIADKYTEADFANLFTRINNSNSLLEYQKLSAQSALMNLLDPDKAKLPTPSEVRLLSEVFHPDFIEALMKNSTWDQKALKALVSTMNIPRALMASADISAPFRQGIMLVGHKEFWKSLGPMFKALFSENNSKALIAEIKGRDTYPLMNAAKLAITDPHKHFLLDREEDFMSDYAEKIPGWGRVVKASNRAYSGFLNRLRADYFDNLVKKYEDLGIDLKHHPEQLKGVGRFINTATGRGDLRAFGKNFNAAAPALNAIFFSPRLIASRVQTFTTIANPLSYVNTDPVLRKEGWKNILSLGSIALSVAGLASMAGMDVETNPRHPDFMKPKIGNTRYDILGGYQQYIRLGAQLLTNSKITGSGKETELGGDGPYDENRIDVIGRFLRSKENPVVSFGHNYLAGKNVIGEKFDRTTDVGGVDVPSEVLERFIPMASGDIMDAMKEHGAIKGAAMGAPAITGIGVQTYEPTKKLPKASNSEEWWKEFEEESPANAPEWWTEWEK